MADRIAFLVPHPPSALRPNRRAAHWATRYKAADEYSEDVFAASWHHRFPVEVKRRHGYQAVVAVTEPWPKARVTYTWRYAGVAPDIDNIAGALKVLQDTLCVAPPPTKNGKEKRDRWYLGLVENDQGIEATFRREKVAKKADEGVYVEIERL